MDQSIRLNQRQINKLVLTQDMRQSIQMLQLDAVDLDAYLKDVAESNPFIEVRSHLERAEDSLSSATFEEMSAGSSTENLFDHLLMQVQLSLAGNPLRQIVVYLINQLNNNGYLILEDRQIVDEIGISPEKLTEAIRLLQGLDPPGVGARNLQECLSLQAHRDTGIPKGVIAILDQDFELLVSHDMTRICEKNNLSTTELHNALDFIKSLSAAPGKVFEQPQPISYIIPDARLSVTNDGQLKLWLTKWGRPELVFAEKTYQDLKKSANSATQQYLKEKHEEYLSLQHGLQRREETLLATVNQIVVNQHAFLLHQAALAPLLLRDVAKALQVNESTVSRTIKGKHLQTDLGIFAFKDFFSKRTQAVSSSAYHSVDQLKFTMTQLIQSENKMCPASDNLLVKWLYEKGFKVARRTVTKYRNELGLPAASARKSKWLK